MSLPDIKANKTQLTTTLKRLRNCYMCSYRSTCKRDKEMVRRKCVPSNVINAYKIIIDYYFEQKKKAIGSAGGIHDKAIYEGGNSPSSFIQKKD